jgi:putative transposase
MPRAHRHYLPGHIWHITHRCHDKCFLLEQRETRQEWLSLLRTAKERYRIHVLGYSVTCNHIHLLVQDPGISNAITRSMQYTQGRIGQRYNERSGRTNAFWGDRYHATAVESGTHLLRCQVYIDLNMVRAGVVAYPSQWAECGYHDIQRKRSRPPLVDRHRLAMLVGAGTLGELQELHEEAIESALERDELQRDGRWSESLAVGSRRYVESFAAALGPRLHGKGVLEDTSADTCFVAESRESYGDDSVVLDGENAVEWERVG